MISSVRGRVVHADADSVVVEVGGVGLSVAVTPQVARGDAPRRRAAPAHDASSSARTPFRSSASRPATSCRSSRSCSGVTGVGPKSALGVLVDAHRRADRRCRRRRRRRAVPPGVGHRAEDREAHRRAARRQGRAPRAGARRRMPAAAAVVPAQVTRRWSGSAGPSASRARPSSAVADARRRPTAPPCRRSCG